MTKRTIVRLAIYYLFILIGWGLISGCSIPQKIVKVPQAVLLPEDMIYTLPKGQLVNITFDGKPMEMSFPSDMKIVNADFLVRQEVVKNDELYKKIKAEKTKGTRNTIFSAILSILATVGGVMLKAKWGKSTKTKINAEIG